MDTPPFDALLGYLGQSEDHNWTQYICEHVAKGVLRRFEAHDWQRLQKMIAAQPAFWQQRCTDALGECMRPEALPLLFSQLHSSDDDSRILAAYHLQWMEVPVGPEVVDALREILSRIPAAERAEYQEITQLLERALAAG